MDFLKWYKNKIESSHLEPPENIWENLQDQLDIDHSWKIINVQLEQNAATKRKYWFAAAAGLLIFILAGGYWWYSSNSNLNLDKQIAQETTLEENKIKKETKINIENRNPEKEINSKSVKEKEDRLNINFTDSIQIAETVVRKQRLKQMSEQKIIQQPVEKNRNNEKLIAALQPYELSIEDFSVQTSETLVLGKSSEIISKGEKNRIAFQKIYTGATGQLANTWLLNNKTYTGLEETSLTTSNASFGSHFGFFTGTNLFEQLFIQLDINIIVQNKQDYNEYLNGQYISNEMKFNYSQIGFSFRYITFSNRYMKGEHNIYAGGYWGYLHSAYQVIDNEPHNITDYYAKSDYGVFLGYEYIFPIAKNLGFGTGIKAMYGLNNIYSGDQYIPSYLNKTHNASLNITFALKYNLK